MGFLAPKQFAFASHGTLVYLLDANLVKRSSV